MRIVFLTGIWPPDVGGPATHGPDFARFLRDRGHEVRVVTMADGEPSDLPVPVRTVDRGRPFVIRYPAVALAGLRLGRSADVIYATATYAAAAAAAAAARRPLVAKLVSDPAYERAWRYRIFRGSLEAFQEAHDRRSDSLKRLRTTSLRRASRIVVPSRYLAEIASGWGLEAERIEVLVNPAPPPSDVEPAPLEPGTFVFVGRLTHQKGLPVLLEAIDAVAGAKLELVGEGADRSALEAVVAKRGSRSECASWAPCRATRCWHISPARAPPSSRVPGRTCPTPPSRRCPSALPSCRPRWAVFPRSCGTARTGCSCRPTTPSALAGALRRILQDDELRDRLAAAAQPSVAAIGRDVVYGRLEQILVEAAAVKPRVLFVGRGRVSLPLAPWLQRKWDALSEVLDLRVLNAGTGGGDPRFRLLPDGAPAFYSRLPFEIARSLRMFPAEVLVASDPYIGAAARPGRTLARSTARLVVEVHGDPRTFTRAYGSPARRLLSGPADAVARSGIRHADATRALSAFTSSIVAEVTGHPATACFPTYSDLSAFRDPPLVPVPAAERVVFVGALESYKNVDGLAAAWRQVAGLRPGAVLTIVGKGSRHAVIDRLVADLPNQVEHHLELPADRVAAAIDAARALVLPSYPEGLGRVVLEAFARGRMVVGTNGGGIPDMATDGVDAILIPRADTDALFRALNRVLEDQQLAVRLGAAAHASYARWHQTAADFATAYRALVDVVTEAGP